jgi:4-alpha-glucanotransferase
MMAQMPGLTPNYFIWMKISIHTFVAGVPPDYFSRHRAVMGNPLYKWSEHEKTGFAWWIERMRTTLQTVDIVRLDHFRGFSGYWEIPAGMPTAEVGRWVKGPGLNYWKHLKMH